MALKKEINKPSGLSINYIRISKIAINYNLNQSIITVEEYLNEEFRDKAKKQTEIRNSLNKLFKQLENTKDLELQKAIVSKIQNIQTLNADILDKNYAISTKDISLDYIPDNVAYEGFYNELKKLDDLKDAEMI